MYERLEILIKENNMTKKQLAIEVGVSPSMFTFWKDGRSIPKIDKLQRLADYFHVSVDWLMGKCDNRDGSDSVDKKRPKDLRNLLADEEITLNGRMMSEEDKERVLRIIEAAFWEAKDMNKRK